MLTFPLLKYRSGLVWPPEASCSTANANHSPRKPPFLRDDLPPGCLGEWSLSLSHRFVVGFYGLVEVLMVEGQLKEECDVGVPQDICWSYAVNRGGGGDSILSMDVRRGGHRSTLVLHHPYRRSATIATTSLDSHQEVASEGSSLMASLAREMLSCRYGSSSHQSPVITTHTFLRPS